MAPLKSLRRCEAVDNAMVKAIARAFRWRDILESPKHETIAEALCAMRPRTIARDGPNSLRTGLLETIFPVLIG